MAMKTPFAELYGEKYPGIPRNNEFKSGYTPIAPYSPSHLYAASIGRNENWQRERLNGFTTRELSELNSLLKPGNLNPGNLKSDALLPLFRRELWEASDALFSEYPFAKRSRQWVVSEEDLPGALCARDDDVVWKALEPCLILASYMFTSCCKHAFVSNESNPRKNSN